MTGLLGLVATSESHAARAGAAALTAGANAVDAAVTAAACLTVTEPTANGLGGDLSALVWDGRNACALDATGAAPAALPSAEAIRARGLDSVPPTGWLAVTVPGQVSGWSALLARFGSISIADALAPAVALARGGFPVGAVTASAWAQAARRFAAFDEWRRVFMPGGRTPEPGERFTNPDLACSLEVIAAGGSAAFYGTLAHAVVAHSEETGGFFARDDFARHAPCWPTPLTGRYGPWIVVEAAPPAQGVVALEALAILDGMDPALDEATAVHRAIEAIKLSFADAYATVADPIAMNTSPRALLADDHLERRRRSIVDDRAGPSPASAGIGGGTVLVCASDRSGMLVSLIQSNFHGFGSGIVVPGTGIALQNRGAGFRLEPGHPNELAPGKRPFHTILPGLLLAAGSGHAIGAFGLMGGQMQPQGHVQLVTALARGASPQEALDRPRWRWLDAGEVALEQGFDAGVAAALHPRGHRIRANVGSAHFGGGQVVLLHDESRFSAGSDRRKDGIVATAAGDGRTGLHD